MMDSYGVSIYFGDKIYTYIYGADPMIDSFIVGFALIVIMTLLFSWWLNRVIVL